MKYEVVCTNGTEYFGTYEECVDYVMNEVKEEANELYENNEIDKYAVQDIMFDLKKYIEKRNGYSYPDLTNEWEIKQVYHTYNIGFTVNGVEDETQFDTSFNKYEHAVIDLMNLFIEFIKENNFNNVEIKYIEEVQGE